MNKLSPFNKNTDNKVVVFKCMKCGKDFESDKHNIFCKPCIEEE